MVACLREHVASSRSLRVDFEKEGIKVITLNADSRYDYRLFGKIVRVLSEERPEANERFFSFVEDDARVGPCEVGWANGSHVEADNVSAPNRAGRYDINPAARGRGGSRP